MTPELPYPIEIDSNAWTSLHESGKLKRLIAPLISKNANISEDISMTASTYEAIASETRRGSAIILTCLGLLFSISRMLSDTAIPGKSIKVDIGQPNPLFTFELKAHRLGCGKIVVIVSFSNTEAMS